jgi:hypothetical protein
MANVNLLPEHFVQSGYMNIYLELFSKYWALGHDLFGRKEAFLTLSCSLCNLLLCFLIFFSFFWTLYFLFLFGLWAELHLLELGAFKWKPARAAPALPLDTCGFCGFAALNPDCYYAAPGTRPELEPRLAWCRSSSAGFCLLIDAWSLSCCFLKQHSV